MEKSEFQLPKFVVPLSWIILLMTTIKDIDEFYTFKGVKSVITILVGVGACISFFILLKNRTGTRQTSSREFKKIYQLGLSASLILLVLPGLISILYPRIIEPILLERDLNNYIKSEKEPANIVRTPKAQTLIQLINIHKKITGQALEVANSLLN